MSDKKELEPKVESSDAKSRFSRKTKIVVIGVLITVLLLGAVISLSVFFTLRKTTSPRLVEVNLDPGETLTYRVDQDIEAQVGETQKGTIRAIVSIRVFNKTSEKYWFLMNFNLSHLSGNADIRGVKIMAAYFLVRLRIDSRTPSNGGGESFEVFGNHSTNEEHLRLVFSVLEQLLPTVRRDLYEDVDGEKVVVAKPLDPEDSPLLPGLVRMHREARTSGNESVLIKNHFDRSDFVNLSSDVDLNLKYSGFASINKSNGMVSESYAYFSEQLNMGEPFHREGGPDITMMNITVKSHISLIDTPCFGNAESEATNFLLFVKLIVPKTAAVFSVDENQTDAFPNVSYPTSTPSNFPLSYQRYNMTNSFVTPPKQRFRRATQNKVVTQVWTKTGPTYLSTEFPIKLFEKKVVGIKVKGTGILSVKNRNGLEIQVKVKISVGGKSRDVFSKKYKKKELQKGKGTRTGYKWKKTLSISIPVYFLRLGVDFTLKCSGEYKLTFPPEGNSLSPPKLTIQIEPFGKVSTSIKAYVSAHILRAGVYGDGTLIRIGLPLTLSYVQDTGSCLRLSSRLTALELSAGIFYQWRKWSWSKWKFYWGKRKTIYKFGKWSAIEKSWKLLEQCT